MLGLGIIGIAGWGILSLVLVIGLLSYGFLHNSSQKHSTPTDVAIQDKSLFASVLKTDSLFGFTQGEEDPRAAILEKYLITRKSPMASAAKTFIEVADQCPMDWALLPAIAGKESAFGRIIPINSYNAFGWAVYTGQNSGAVFDSWEHAIQRVGQGICDNYIKRGLDTPEKMEPLYTPPSYRTHGGWRTDVTFMMEQIKNWK
ncbi:glucosaminidase domain-containing protein [candidate division WWE3 bacterium]|uniref:Glucosaminidase domain-containing protein n=1 Tax=candidate division WWE3 bacterium TaxID=2053526 RepID=A0A955LVN8_UNCKA|nr:glucosaminidase domain-containing protein [candidate division WWE3 bacterium]